MNIKETDSVQQHLWLRDVLVMSIFGILIYENTSKYKIITLQMPTNLTN